MEDCIGAVESAFREYAMGNVVMPTRSSVDVAGHGIMFSMPSLVADSALAVKIVTVFPENPNKHQLPTVIANVTVLDPETGKCLAFMSGTTLTALRTGATTGLATKLLSRQNAARLAIFGSGVQAEYQLEAIASVRELERVIVYSPHQEHARRFASRMSSKLNAKVDCAGSSEDALRGADIIVAATTSRSPVFDGRSVAPGTHINGVGSHTPDVRELDSVTIQRSKVVVDSRNAALVEAGDLIIPMREGIVTSNNIWAELGEVLIGKRPGRMHDQEITVFKSVGIAIQDAAVGFLAYKRAEGRALGIQV
jgi:ornithine cyclodeaminase/alanine dehydrogenase